MGIIRDNPILQREGMPKLLRHTSRDARLYIAVGAALSSAILALLLSQLHWKFSDLLAQIIAWGWGGIITLIVPSYSARTIVQERLQGTWDSVILSRLRPSEIIFGKLLAPLLPFWLWGLFFLPSCLILALTGSSLKKMFSPLPMPITPLLLVLLAYAWAIIGSFSAASFALYCSFRCSSAATALLWTYLPLFIIGWPVYLLGLVAFPVMLWGFIGLDKKKREG